MLRRLIPLVAVAAAVAGVPASAQAAFPGTPGKIAWANDRDGDFDIYTANRNGTGVVNLTADDPNAEVDTSPSWSADGTRIVWASSRGNPGQGGQELDLWIMNADGSGKVNLTPAPGPTDVTLERNPAFSPDGKRIAFTNVSDAGELDIALINADGTGRRILTGGNAAEEQAPAFSQDGGTIYYSNLTQGNRLWRMSADGSNQTQLTFREGNSVQPDVSPDGRSVLFVSEASTDAFGLDPWVMGADGSNQRPLINVEGNTFSATFSPSGQEILFTNETGSPPDAVEDLHLAGIGGGPVTPFLPGPGADITPDWQAIPYKCRGRVATIVGSFGRDTLRGTPGDDVMIGLPGRDKILGGGGKDRICAGAGRDKLQGGAGNDTLIGGAGFDRLDGGKGNDRLFGGTPGARKAKKGGTEVNECSGGAGDDKLSKNCR